MDYALEIIENLDLLEASLLGALRTGENADTHLVGIIFRYAHNTKGLLAMAGEEACRDGIHELETTLDQVRNGKANLTEQFGTLALELITALHNAANDEESSRPIPEIAADIRHLRDSAPQSVKLSLRACPKFETTNEARAALGEAAVKKHHLYVTQKIVSAEASEAEWRGLPIFEDIPTFGTVISAAAIGAASDDGAKTIQILFTSPQPPEEMELLVFDPHYEVEFPAQTSEVAQKKSKNEKSSQQNNLPLAQVPPSRPLRALIIDDEGTSRKLLENTLKGDFECEVTCNGQEGLFSFMLALEENEPFDLICLDVSMPIIDGAKALSLIRRMERERGVGGHEHVPVLMITAERDPQLVAKSFFASCEAFLHKPLNVTQLKAVLGDLKLSPSTKGT